MSLPARAIPGVPACWWKHPPHAYKPHIRPMRIDRWRGWHVFIEGRNFYLSTFALVGDLFRAHTLGLLEGLELEYEEELPDRLLRFRRQGLDLVLA